MSELSTKTKLADDLEVLKALIYELWFRIVMMLHDEIVDLNDIE